PHDVPPILPKSAADEKIPPTKRTQDAFCFQQPRPRTASRFARLRRRTDHRSVWSVNRRPRLSPYTAQSRPPRHPGPRPWPPAPATDLLHLRPQHLDRLLDLPVMPGHEVRRPIVDPNIRLYPVV